MAAAGAIFTRVNTVRTLSGIAAILAGVREEVNQNLYSNLTIQIVTDGLEYRRHSTYKKILNNRKQGFIEYPIERAVVDVAQYHKECSQISGLEHTAIAIERAGNPSLKVMQRTLMETRRLQKIMNTDFDELSNIEGIQTGLPGPMFNENNLFSSLLMDDGIISQPSLFNISSTGEIKKLPERMEKLIANTKEEKIYEDVDGFGELKELFSLSTAQSINYLQGDIQEKAIEYNGKISRAAAELRAAQKDEIIELKWKLDGISHDSKLTIIEIISVRKENKGILQEISTKLKEEREEPLTELTSVQKLIYESLKKYTGKNIDEVSQKIENLDIKTPQGKTKVASIVNSREFNL